MYIHKSISQNIDWWPDWLISVGPAGTGKTESVKALGHQLGRFVLVFNCDERFDFQVKFLILFKLTLLLWKNMRDSFDQIQISKLKYYGISVSIWVRLMGPNSQRRFVDKLRFLCVIWPFFSFFWSSKKWLPKRLVYQWGLIFSSWTNLEYDYPKDSTFLSNVRWFVGKHINSHLSKHKTLLPHRMKNTFCLKHHDNFSLSLSNVPHSCSPSSRKCE